MKQNVLEFLNKYHMHFDEIDLERSTKEFMRQMNTGNEGHVESLMMIPTYIRMNGDVKRNEPVIVMDAGGTNFRAAVVEFDSNGKAVISNFSKRPMPGTQGAITSDEFFDTLAAVIEPFDKISDKVGFCFSFPTEILPNCDGRLIAFGKEVVVTGAEGKILGESINEALEKRGCSKKKFVIINDTVAAMLGAIAEHPDKKYDSYIGFILGTGTNTCYIEHCKNIKRLSEAESNLMAINMETGNFNGFTRGEIDFDFDATTLNCNDHIYEKMISGAYQGGLIFMTVKRAATDGLFCDETVNRLNNISTFTMRDIDDFCKNTKSGNLIADLAATESDRETIYEIIDCSFERAARMVSVNLGAIAAHIGLGKSAEHPICVSAEGTTFYKSVLFRPKLDKYVKNFVEGELGCYLEFVKCEDSTLIGSAVAALLN